MSDLSHKNISRIKNVSHEDNELNGTTAYLNLESRDFVLHFPDSKTGNILKTNTDEIIILYQRINGERYFTHLVQPLENEIIEENARVNFRFGRFVRTIAYTGEQGKIPFELAYLDLRNRGYGNAVEIKNIIEKKELENYQKNIWNLFSPFFDSELKDISTNSQNFFNDDLNQDFETQEGKLLFKNHRIRERDSKITFKKKEIAKQQNKLFCEVCDFSFAQIYGEEYIECHHTVPISEGERITKLEDLSLVCSNCHRMLHRKINGKYLSINDLKQTIFSLEDSK